MPLALSIMPQQQQQKKKPNKTSKQKKKNFTARSQAKRKKMWCHLHSAAAAVNEGKCEERISAALLLNCIFLRPF